jgi:hypothetical protein
LEEFKNIDLSDIKIIEDNGEYDSEFNKLEKEIENVELMDEIDDENKEEEKKPFKIRLIKIDKERFLLKEDENEKKIILQKGSGNFIFK